MSPALLCGSSKIAFSLALTIALNASNALLASLWRLLPALPESWSTPGGRFHLAATQSVKKMTASRPAKL